MKRKKLYYLPGMISLLGLPVLLLLFLPERKASPVALKMLLPNDNTNNHPFSKYAIYKAIKFKKVTTVHLWDLVWPFEDYNLNAKMDFITREIERLQFTNDTNSVLKIEFGEENTYGDYVWIVNQALIYRVKRYAYADNSLYFFANDPPVRAEPLPVEFHAISGDDSPAWRPTKWFILKRKLQRKFDETVFIVKQNYLPATAFLAMILLPGIIHIVRFAKRSIRATNTKPV
jgi:hypothetical protein